MISKRDWDRDRLRSYWAENPGPRSFNFAGPLGALLKDPRLCIRGTNLRVHMHFMRRTPFFTCGGAVRSMDCNSCC